MPTEYKAIFSTITSSKKGQRWVNDGEEKRRRLVSHFFKFGIINNTYSLLIFCFLTLYTLKLPTYLMHVENDF